MKVYVRKIMYIYIQKKNDENVLNEFEMMTSMKYSKDYKNVYQ